jgi:prepilin signal peptidase PulO-like enzyme (type II secretory pathway)
MIIVVLAVVGLCLGSFVNALVWRLHERKTMQGRSMCPQCGHQLAAQDLVPVLSWLWLRGKCRYCGKPISPQYPVVELATALVFVASYIWWPLELTGAQTAIFVIWLAILAGLMALLVYDLRWYLLPNRLIYPLSGLALLMAVIRIAAAPDIQKELLYTVLAVLVGGGIFYLLFQLSKGKWIGGGDVKLGWMLGLMVGTPARALLLIFIASVLGTAVSLPLLSSGKLKRTSVIPFGPFLIIAAIIVQLFGAGMLEWYRRTFITF